MNHGVDRYRRPQRLSLSQEQARREEREHTCSRRSTTSGAPCRASRAAPRKTKRRRARFPAEPQENLLYFIEKNAPLLEPWQREMVRIVRKIAQYFYPQRQTQVMNEGWATFWHYTLLNTLYDEGLLADGFMMELLQSHTNVVYQPPIGHRAYSGINPYALGFAMITDIRRICEKPTEEDIALVPGPGQHRLGDLAALRDAQLQGRELHRPVPVAQADARLPLLHRARQGERARAGGVGHP